MAAAGVMEEEEARLRAPPPTVDGFEAYFRMADGDGDGRVSGREAVSFFTMTELPREVLRQIWYYCAREDVGFLEREEFYNALRLVTVAQTGLELTEEIVKIAVGPASAKIPPPAIYPYHLLNEIPSSQPQLKSVLTSASVGVAVEYQKANLPFKEKQFCSSDGNSTATTARRIGSSGSGSVHPQWPKMNLADIQKYMSIFAQVDTDKDGKLAAEQALKLFLSWGLPREVLDKVLDLSDQDSDIMLSMREFCIALYLMERFREGFSLPNELPNSVKFDDKLLFTTALDTTKSPGNVPTVFAVRSNNEEETMLNQSPEEVSTEQLKHAALESGSTTITAEDVELDMAIQASIVSGIEEGVLPVPQDLDAILWVKRRKTAGPVVDSTASADATLEGGQGRIRTASGRMQSMGCSGTCSICLDAPVEGACVPCGHMVGCMPCMNEIKSQNWGCPVCRAKVDQVIKLYAVS